MSQEVVKTFKELVDRLEAANIQGGLLEHVRLIEGPYEGTIKDEDLPVIIYEVLNGGLVDESGFPKCARASMTVMLNTMTAKNDGYYNDEKSGILDYYEKVMTVVDGTTVGSLTGSGNWDSAPDYRIGGFSLDGLKYNYLIEVDLKSKKYQKGAL